MQPSSAVIVIDIAWLAFLLVWVVTAFSVKPVARGESTLTKLLHRFRMAVTVLLLFSPLAKVGMLGLQIISKTPWTQTGGMAMTVLGIAFAIWARLNLGGNWSAMVTIKQDHSLVRTGPYRFVRHPIYSGLLLGFAGTMIAFGKIASVVAFVLVFIAFVVKLRREEEFLRDQFGPSYVEYQQEVKGLVPFVF